MKFLDAAYAQSVDQFVSALQHEGADGFTYYIGGNTALHPWQLSEVLGVRAAGYQAMGIYVSSVIGRDGSLDGAAAAALQGLYAPDLLCCWDLEPGIYRDNPTFALEYGIAWAEAVRRAGLSPVLYSTPDGCAAIGDKGFDAVWAAVPGNCDPSTIFAPTFFPGRVAVQCGWGVWDGVTYDVNYGQFTFPVVTLEPPVVTPAATVDVMPAEITFPAVLVEPAQ